MRQRELIDGVAVLNEEGQTLAKSRVMMALHPNNHATFDSDY